MKNLNIIKNYLYNSVYQVLIIIIPIITTPYISRVIGAEGIGSYTSSLGVAQLFYIIGMIGISNYGSRAIAYVRDNKSKLNSTFWEIWILQIIFSIISIVAYIIIFIVYDFLSLKLICILQIPVVIGAIFDITWLYIGVEDFKKTVSRNIIVKLIAIILIFSLVKSQKDIYKYVIINSVSTFIGLLTMWIFIKQYIGKIDLKLFNFYDRFKGAIVMLIPQLAVQLYTGLDRTIIGSLSNLSEAGIYDQSQKISRIALGLVTSLSLVLMPKIANMFAKNDNKEIERYLYKSLNFTMAISCLISAGIAGTSKHFVPIFFGEGFNGLILYTMLTSLIVIFIPLGGVFSNQFALPTGKNKEYIIPLLLAAFINIILNFILVPIYGALGGVISIIITEFITMINRIIFIKKYINLNNLLSGIWIYFFAGIISFIITNLISEKLSIGITSIILESIICIIIYLLIICSISKFIKDILKNIIKMNRRIVN